jgi:hypothetical protein
MDLLVHGVTLRNGYPASLNSGGGFYANVGSGSRVTLESNSLEANTAPANGGGAYVSAGGGTVTFTSNSIQGNTCSNVGGGASVGAGTVTFTNNSIQGNTCAFGGGAYVSAGTVTFTNNSIEGNAAFRSSGSPYGGGLRLRLGTDEASASATLYNNVFWNNVAPTGADLYVGNDDDNDFLPTPVTLLHNNFDQQPGGFYSDLPITIHRSNFDAVDPLFVDAANGDLHLSPDSWMIDAGDSARPDLPEFDLDGTPRVLGASVDIGAYEYDDGSDSRGILVVIQAGTGSGRVTSTPTGIDCGDDCTEVFVLDSTVSLDATPDAGSIFYGWSGDTDCDDGMLTMDRNKSCTATFNVIAPLQITKAGSGDGVVTSDLPGIQCGEDCTADFPVGSTITLTADANPGSEFVGWDGGTCCRGTCVVDIDQVKDVTATFKLTSDVNGDGVVNSLDVQMVINHALGTVE